MQTLQQLINTVKNDTIEIELNKHSIELINDSVLAAKMTISATDSNGYDTEQTVTELLNSDLDDMIITINRYYNQYETVLLYPKTEEIIDELKRLNIV